MLARMPAITANAYRALRGLPRVRPDPSLGFAEGFLYMLTGGRPDAEAVRVFDLTLTCYIEHEMPNSTFAARVIASTLSDLYGALVGAAASLKGPLHGGANEAVAHMLLDILQHGGAEAAEAYILERLRRGERIMGFGHRVYMRHLRTAPKPRSTPRRSGLRSPRPRAHTPTHGVAVLTTPSVRTGPTRRPAPFGWCCSCRRPSRRTVHPPTDG